MVNKLSALALGTALAITFVGAAQAVPTPLQLTAASEAGSATGDQPDVSCLEPDEAPDVTDEPTDPSSEGDDVAETDTTTAARQSHEGAAGDQVTDEEATENAGDETQCGSGEVGPGIPTTDEDDGAGAEDDDGDQGVGYEGDEDDAQDDGNHGGAVRVAAHCEVRGYLHGELVRSIAKNKEATPADAEAACVEALAKAHSKPGHHAKSSDQAKSQADLSERATPNKQDGKRGVRTRGRGERKIEHGSTGNRSSAGVGKPGGGGGKRSQEH
jgi:hypothetical protein